MPADRQRVHLIAINEGRLIDFFGGTAGKSAFGELGLQILDFFAEDGTGLAPWLLIVDLNRRSVVADITASPAIRSSNVSSRRICAQSSGHPAQSAVGANAVPPSSMRIRSAIRCRVTPCTNGCAGCSRWSTYIGTSAVTMRDLRSALSWLIFRRSFLRGCGCAVVGKSAVGPASIVLLHQCLRRGSRATGRTVG